MPNVPEWKFNLQTTWLPLALVVTIVAGVAGGSWWLRGLTSKVDSIGVSVDKIEENMNLIAGLSQQVGENSGRGQAIADRILSQDEQLAMMASWILTTRIALAQQGFKTPDFDYPMTQKKE